MKKMKAVRLHAIGDLRCDMVDVPVPQGQELLVKVGACGICGSDLPRTFAHGSSNGKYPLTIGHEFSGEVVAVGEAADASLIGQRGAVFPLIPCGGCEPCRMGSFAQCEHYDYLGSRRDGGFAEYCLIPSAWHLVPSASASMEALAMTEPACVAQHAIRQSGAAAGSFVVIFGAGPIGIMAARWAKLFGATPMLVDVVEQKVEFARAKGFLAVNSQKEDVTAAVIRFNGGRLADAAIEGTGVGSVTAACIECVRAHGTVALLGNPLGDTTLPLKLHSMLLRKELILRGVWNSSRAPWPVDEWQYTVHMLDQGQLVVEDLITDRVALNELPALMDAIHRREKQIIKAVCV